MTKSDRLTKQIAGTMAMEGMRLNKNELALVKACASGKKSSAVAIKELIGKYTVKRVAD